MKNFWRKSQSTSMKQEFVKYGIQIEKIDEDENVINDVFLKVCWLLNCDISDIARSC